MFGRIQSSLWAGLPGWADASPDYKRLYSLQKVLDGCQYRKMSIPFWQDSTEGSDDYIPLINRHPLVTFNLAKALSRKVARKMFAGRQKPTLYAGEEGDSDDGTESQVQDIEALLREGFFEQQLLRTVQNASIGAAAMTFSIIKDGSQTPRIVFCSHAATECLPTFDALGELTKLRIEYICQGIHFLRQGYKKDSRGDDLQPTGDYWYICDYEKNRVVTMVPALQADYQPFSWPPIPEGAPPLKEDDTVFPEQKHGLGFVPGHWFCSLSQGPLPWGGCYWESGMDTATTLDYTASQLIKSLWYAGHPDLVVKGKVLNAWNGRVIRDASKVIQFAAARADSAQNRVEGGDAKLLETNGAGFEQTREACEFLRKLFMEQVQGSRKDPDRMRTTAMSAAAMVNMDEDLVDLMQELRTDLGEQGSLVITKKAVRAAQVMGHPIVEKVDKAIIGRLAYQWPPPFGLSAAEIFNLAQGVDLLVNPEQPAPQGTDAEGKPVGEKPEPVEPLLTHPEARALVLSALNIPQLSRTASRPQDPKGDE